jgi:hypothetical protein
MPFLIKSGSQILGYSWLLHGPPEGGVGGSIGERDFFTPYSFVSSNHLLGDWLGHREKSQAIAINSESTSSANA